MSPINSKKRNFNSDIGDLHIGITSSTGETFDFDQNGLNRNSIKWSQTPSIVIKLELKLNSIDASLFKNSLLYNNLNKEQVKSQMINERWDSLLENYWKHKENKWCQSIYDEFNFNCLDFIIIFLLEYGFFDINYEHNEETYLSFNNRKANEKQTMIMNNFLREKLSRELIEPEFIKCLKYLNLLLKLKKEEYFSENIKE